MSALRRNASQTEATTNMAAIHKQNQIFTPIVGATHGRGGYLVPRATAGRVRRGGFRGVSGQGVSGSVEGVSGQGEFRDIRGRRLAMAEARGSMEHQSYG